MISTPTRPRTPLRKRHVQNWLILAIFAVAVALYYRPERSDLTGPVGEVLDGLGWALLACGILLRIAARGWKFEQPRGVLVTNGPYGMVRHPLYLASFLIGLGLCALAGCTWLVLLFTACYWLVHGPVATREEAVLAQKWPVELAEYQARVPAFLPRIADLSRPRSFFPRRLLPAVIREADALCAWPLTAVGLRLWGLLSAAPRHLGGFARPEVSLLGGLAGALVAAWIALKLLFPSVRE
jgi:protein-S-isoprenylcysteine O-methyltransferase Ste14